MFDTQESAPAPSQQPARPPLQRRRDGRLLSGVARGVSEHLQVRPILVRLAFVVLALPLFGGLGVLLYVVLWAVLPSDRTSVSWRDRKQWPVFVALGLGLAAFMLTLGWTGVGTLFGWVAAVVAFGAGVIWHQVRPDAEWLDTLMGSGERRTAVLRIVGGGALVAVGVVGTLAILVGLNRENVASFVNSLVFTAIAVAGMALVFGPLVWRAVTQLRVEREARVRASERADIAAMVHDQVLHTLALIQRRAGDQREVMRLARGQERALRNWLYQPSAAPDETFKAALEAAAAEVEDSFAIELDAVIVGDCDLDPHSSALVAAAREAMVNAAKHAGVAAVSLYAEVETSELAVFVRDRGVGFDPDEVADDRHGIRGSIMDRMERHGGSAEVRSTPGEGTEVRLTMPREEEER